MRARTAAVESVDIGDCHRIGNEIPGCTNQVIGKVGHEAEVTGRQVTRIVLGRALPLRIQQTVEIRENGAVQVCHHKAGESIIVQWKGDLAVKRRTRCRTALAAEQHILAAAVLRPGIYGEIHGAAIADTDLELVRFQGVNVDVFIHTPMQGLASPSMSLVGAPSVVPRLIQQEVLMR